MNELTMERLVDAEQLDVQETIAPDEVTISAEIIPAIEVESTPNVVLCQRAVGGTAILCAGCPLVRFCPSARSGEDTPAPSDEILTEPDIFASDSTSSESAKPVLEKAAEAPKIDVEQPRSYLAELLDDKVEIVVAQSLRQPVEKKMTQVEPPEPSIEKPAVFNDNPGPKPEAPVVTVVDAPVIGLETVDRPVEVANEIVSIEIVDDTIEPEPVPELEPTLTLAEPDVNVDKLPGDKVIEMAITTEVAEVAPVIDVDDIVVADTNEVVDVVKVESLLEADVEEDAFVADPVETFIIADNSNAEVDVDTDVEVVPDVETIITEIIEPDLPVIEVDNISGEPDIDDEPVIPEDKLQVEVEVVSEGYSQTSVNSKSTTEEFSYVWHTYTDDLDEEHWLLDNDSIARPIATKLKRVMAKFLGRHAFYALSSSGSNSI